MKYFNTCHRILFAFLLLCFPVILACTKNQEQTNDSSKNIITFIYANTQNSEHPRSQSMLYFKELLEKKTNGRITVELHFSGTLGKEDEVLDMVKKGIIQGCRGGLFDRANKKYILYTLPFIFRNIDEVKAVLDSDFGKSINTESLQNGFYIPACGIAGGFRNISNNKRPITSYEDIKNMNLRTPPLPVTIKTFEALKANPQQINYTDTYLSLKEGIVDGQENPFSNIVDMKFYEVQKYLSIINWQIHPDPFYVNPQWYHDLPKELQLLFDSVVQETMNYSNRIWIESENTYLDFLQDKLQINIIAPDKIRIFEKAVMPVWEYFISIGYFSRKDIDTVQKIIINASR
ncbi:MAG: TRAP transporter substrate-binding protein [Spirochaetales bacterium]|nr:TRAP transporter substrate-binding protein [Spirochaetales bacterium]